MMKIFAFIIAISLSYSGFSQTSVYNLRDSSINEGYFEFKNFEGRAIMIVNVASSEKYTKQLEELQQLHDQYRDSGLVIIAFPTDEFGNEKRDGEQLKSFYNNYTFLVASKTAVKDSTAEGIFGWLREKQDNGVADNDPQNDFTKYIINREGKLVAAFSSIVSPLNPVIIQTIMNN